MARTVDRVEQREVDGAVGGDGRRVHDRQAHLPQLLARVCVQAVEVAVLVAEEEPAATRSSFSFTHTPNNAFLFDYDSNTHVQLPLE